MSRNIVTASDLTAARGLYLGEPEVGVVTPPEAPDARTIAPQPALRPQVQPTVDGYLDRLVKYVPPEVIAAFLAIEGAIESSPAPGASTLAWVVFFILLAATPIYLRRFAGVTKPRQLAISSVAFVIWALAFHGLPFSELKIPSLYPSVAVVLFTFLIPLANPD